MVIDEQHRFGVHQRLALQAKGSGSGADLLVMTATPIPRTLLLTSYGDMDVSRLDEKPPGRKPIATRTVPLERLDEVVDGIERARSTAARRPIGSARWSPSREVLDLAAAEERYAELRASDSASGRPGPWPAGRQGQGSRHGGVRRRASSRSWCRPP